MMMTTTIAHRVPRRTQWRTSCCTKDLGLFIQRIRTGRIFTTTATAPDPTQPSHPHHPILVTKTPSPPPLPLAATAATMPTTSPPPSPPSSLKYSVRRRAMPRMLTSLHSIPGQELLIQSLLQQSAASYVHLTIHFTHQSDPAFCGITTLLVILNALAIDPHTRWKGGWRYFGNEESLLARCCLPAAHVQHYGVTVDEFYRLAHCQGLDVTLKRAAVLLSSSSSNATTASLSNANAMRVQSQQHGTLEAFRQDVQAILMESSASSSSSSSSTTSNHDHGHHHQKKGLLVTSFGRSGLGQTGDGHFSPIAAYHAASDQVLILDVARFKYPPYWVRIETLFKAMTQLDPVTQLPRGWFILNKKKKLKKETEMVEKYAAAAAITNSHDHPPLPRQLDSDAARIDHNAVDDSIEYEEEYAMEEEDEDEDEEDEDALYHTAVAVEEDRRPAHIVPTQQEASHCPLHHTKIEYCKNNYYNHDYHQLQQMQVRMIHHHFSSCSSSLSSSYPEQ